MKWIEIDLCQTQIYISRTILYPDNEIIIIQKRRRRRRRYSTFNKQNTIEVMRKEDILHETSKKEKEQFLEEKTKRNPLLIKHE